MSFSKSRKYSFWFEIILVFLGLIALAFYTFVVYMYIKRFDLSLDINNFHFGSGSDGDDQQTLFGVFGDFVGGIVNPLLSFFSLVALLLTITYQRRQLIETQEELRRSRQDVVRQEKRQDIYRVIEVLKSRVDQILTTKIDAFSLSLCIEPNKDEDRIELLKEKLRLNNKTFLNLFSDYIISVSCLLKYIDRYQNESSDTQKSMNSDIHTNDLVMFFRTETRESYIKITGKLIPECVAVSSLGEEMIELHNNILSILY